MNITSPHQLYMKLINEGSLIAKLFEIAFEDHTYTHYLSPAFIEHAK